MTFFIFILLLILKEIPSSSSISNITLTGHTSYIYSIVLSSDNTKLATGSADETAIIWS